MAIRVAIKHDTIYHFDRQVAVAPHVVRLRPAPHTRTPILSYSLDVEPGDHFINWQQDPFGNYLARLVFQEKTNTLAFRVEVIAELVVINPFDFFLDDSASVFPVRYDDNLKTDLAPYLQVRENGDLLREWLLDVKRGPDIPMIDFLVAINQRLQQDISYLIRMQPGVQTCEETLGNGSGSCRDSAWLLVQILRHLGLAARFTSGYLVQLKADTAALDGPSGPEADFTDLHAWAEVYLPGAGWVGLDPTSGLFAGEGHIPLACTPDPVTAAAISGSTDVCESTMEFTNEVTRIHEDPRVTRPFNSKQWQDIDALGDAVDQILDDRDVRLTMGGEPTFVSIDDMEGDQWNTAALGDDKRALAGELLERLRHQFAPDGMVQVGQGKWYPGEPLPRWALSLFWRTDGVPLWSAKEYLADETRDYGFGINDAQKLSHAIAAAFGIKLSRVIPAYEDQTYYLWKEGKLGEGETPANNKLRDPLERKRMRRLFARGLDEPTGYAIPLKEVEDDTEIRWKTSRWPFQDGHLFLVPGDSPMGLRIPLESLDWHLKEDIETTFDFFAPRPPLRQSPMRKRPPAIEDKEIVHTALCIEPRDGKLYIFLPPVKRLEPFVELLADLERVIRRLRYPVIFEGYQPPRDPRMNLLQITPDPGVIEVNVHPASSWRMLVDNTTRLYEEARLTRLGTEKFMLDGRHSGTGGGNHVTMGSSEAADSPFLRRPHLLRSLVSFWQNHPALSYLFSGLFIGPTSQAPRVDEARDDNLYELELSFKLMPEGDTDQPWLTDRLLRNFLVDLTGNTHRAEFCIDKLYSPDSANGRRGLLELRAFEMPPHPQMSLVQMLLLRALVAHFWDHPYEGRLVRWGSGLHDRFMLQHYIWEDLREVTDFLNDNGLPVELDWFLPFREFRFPLLGRLHLAGMEMSLHNALEPWHVLGEESSAQGTSRYVDSSVERVQVTVTGFIPERYAITCNRRTLPMVPTDVPGQFVCGVRFKAWEPPSALHPTIAKHTPLVFDIVDRVNQRSVGGCSYHVVHPGGRSYDTFPVNANEAEGRRHSRFETHGHSHGAITINETAPHPDHPHSLDLRYPD